MSCECFSSPPSDRTSAHRSPMVCSRWGSTSNTAGNWLIHCLATKQNRKHVYYSQIEQDNQFRHAPSFNGLECPYSPGKVADLCPPESSLVGGTVLISKNNSQGSKHTVQIIPNSRDIYLKSALQTWSAKQSHACFLIWLINMGMWLGAVHQWNQSITLSGSGGYRERSFWANASDGTTQLCIIRVMWTNWVPLGLEVLPSESASKTEQWIHRRRINVIKNNKQCNRQRVYVTPSSSGRVEISDFL